MAALDLELFELLGDPAVVRGELGVFGLVLFVKLGVLLLELDEALASLPYLPSLLPDRALVLVVPLDEHPVVVLQLLRVELVRRAHRLEVLLQILHIRLQPNLEHVVLRGIRCAALLELVAVLERRRDAVLHEVLLQDISPLEQRVHVRLVLLEEFGALFQKDNLGAFQLRRAPRLTRVEGGSIHTEFKGVRWS